MNDYYHWLGWNLGTEFDYTVNQLRQCHNSLIEGGFLNAFCHRSGNQFRASEHFFLKYAETVFNICT